ncbi:MAG: DUF5702 domain-containing protein [Clostridia bacterium]|nr:DUF5702 domain-containing protein [Clostridia bacterium]
MMNFQRKQGSSAVFLSIVLAALVCISLTLVFAARNRAEISFADGVMHLAADSLLGEYDYYVQRDYGLFLLQDTDRNLTRKLNRYAGYSLDAVDGAEFDGASVNAGRYSTVDPEPVRAQILAFMKSGGAGKLLTGTGASDTGTNSDRDSGHTLRHGPTIVSLPSRSLPDRSIIAAAEKLADNMKNPETIFRKSTAKYVLDSYILSMFNSCVRSAAEDHFFNNEVEYIICGELSDDRNRHKVDLALTALRTGLNLSHIYSDPDKLAAVTAAAEIITPGVLGTVTQAGIALAWATAEAKNDVKLLHSGSRVPIIKDTSSWAIDLDALIEGYDSETGCIHPAVDRGRPYEDYLRILLFIKDDNIKTARILDLIQINMRKNHDENFLIQECATGISIDSKVNGEILSYDKKY